MWNAEEGFGDPSVEAVCSIGGVEVGPRSGEGGEKSPEEHVGESQRSRSSLDEYRDDNDQIENAGEKQDPVGGGFRLQTEAEHDHFSESSRAGMVEPGGARLVAYGENTMTAEREGESGEDDDDQKWAAVSE